MERLSRTRWDGTGEGRSFLLVHGLASNQRLWDGVGEALAAAGCTAVAFDQRGHGESPKPDGGYGRWETFVDDAAQVMEEERLAPCVVVGQSWGASVVVELARRRPEFVRGVACVDGGVVDLRDRFPTWDACARALTPPMIKGMPWNDLEAQVRARHEGWPPSAVDAALACFHRDEDGTAAPNLTVERHMEILRLLWEHRPAEALAEVTAPVLLLPCSGDATKEFAVVRAMDAMGRRGSLRWFDAHHDVHAQHPVALADALLEFAV